MSDSLGLFCNIYPYIQDTVVEASETDIERSMQMAVREFAVDTEIFSEVYTIDIVADQATYVLESIYKAKNYRIAIVAINGANLVNSQYTLSTSGRILTLIDIPSAAATGGLVLTTVLKPDLTCTQLDEDQMELWYEALISLTKGKLHAQPRKPWSDPVEASYQLGIYEGYVELVAQDRVTLGQSGPTTVNFGARV